MDEAKASALRQIAEELKSSPCPLRRKGVVPVAGEGNPDADVLFLGEAPGRAENEQGRPFVGAAGKIFDDLLRVAGLLRTDVFITSIEKFHPPQNRAPTRNEIAACLPYLQSQIAIIKPTLIVTLGRHALQVMLEWDGEPIPLPSMDLMHGKIILLSSGLTCYAVHHPAAVLHQRKLKPLLEQDFARIPKIVASLTHISSDV